VVLWASKSSRSEAVEAHVREYDDSLRAQARLTKPRASALSQDAETETEERSERAVPRGEKEEEEVETVGEKGYDALARALAARGYTGLFEWCERGRVVGVLRAEETRLVLTAARHCVTGPTFISLSL